MRIAALIILIVSLTACTTTEAEKDAQYNTPRIPLSNGTVFTQRATPASTCHQKYNEMNRVSKIMKQEGFMERGKGELLVFKYQTKLISDILDNCKPFIMNNGR